MENFSLCGRRPLFLLLLTLFAAGCSSNDDADSGNGGGGNEPPLARGALVRNPPELVTTLSAVALLADASDPLQQALLLQAGTPVCDIAVHRIEYTSVGGADEATHSTGALMVPTGAAARCQGARPIVLYAHGTTTDVAFDLTRLENDERGENAEGLFLAAYFAAQGYIVVAPNYAGYAGSTLGYHPYLNGDQQSKDMIDALKAARSALPTSAAQGTTDGGKLYVTGYSQGGYVALATERAMEAAGQHVDAAVPMSGPYALSAFADAVFAGRVNGGAPIFTTLLLTAYQKSYGNAYTSVNDVYSAQYADGIESLLPSTRLHSAIYAAGDLPSNALFSSEPPAPEYANVTPATDPQVLAKVFKRGFSIAKDVLRAAAVAQGASDGGDEAVLEAYHAGLVAPFCIEAARKYFEAH